MKKVIIKRNISGDVSFEAEEIIDKDDESIINTKGWRTISLQDNDIFITNNNIKNIYWLKVCIYPTSLKSFIILIKEDRHKNEYNNTIIYEIYNMGNTNHCPMIKKYIIKNGTIFEFPPDEIEYNIFKFDYLFYDDILIKDNYDFEEKIANELVDITGCSNFRFFNGVNSNYVANKNVYYYKNMTNYSNLMIANYKSKDIYFFSIRNNSFIWVETKSLEINRIICVDLCYNYQHMRIIDYEIHSHNRIYVNKCIGECSPLTYDDFIFISNLATMNTNTNCELEEKVLEFLNNNIDTAKNKFFTNYGINPGDEISPLIGILFIISIIIIVIIGAIR